ncbi:MAG: hypothetical protein ACOC00_06610 [Halothiobacillaceae bacterium]
MFKRVFLRMLAVMLCAVPMIGVADDFSGVFEIGEDDQMTIHYRDEDTIRFEMPDPQGGGEEAAYLIIDGGTYVITGNEVIDMADMGGMIGGLAQGMMEELIGETETPEPADLELEATGRQVEVAGLEGELHTWSDGRSQGELVLSDEAGAVALTRAWMRLAERMVESMGMGDDPMMADMARMQDHPDMAGLGILRSQSNGQPAERLELIEFSDQSLPDRVFELPAEPVKMPAMPLGGGNMPDMNDPAVQQMMRDMVQKQMGL